MDLNRLTEKTQEALQRAQALATRRNHQGVDVEHLLAALLDEREGLATAMLAGRRDRTQRGAGAGRAGTEPYPAGYRVRDSTTGPCYAAARAHAHPG